MLLRENKVSNVANNLKLYRLEHHMKQKDMAELLEMHYQNYSQMERGVYTPSLEKLVEICGILGLTPNDLLLEGREFEDQKQQIFESLDASVLDIIDTMKIVEEKKAEAMIAKQNGNDKEERFLLDDIIQIFAYRNEHFWGIADFLYRKYMNDKLDKISQRTVKSLMEQMQNVKK
jgi:transcriptional regulator with XRE-family HTH domain